MLNQQREVIYPYRDEVLEGRDMSDAAREEIGNLIERLVDEYTAGDFVEDWDIDGLVRRVEEIFTRSERDRVDSTPSRLDREELTDALAGGGARRSTTAARRSSARS